MTHDKALYKSTDTLLYFTLIHQLTAMEGTLCPLCWLSTTGIPWCLISKSSELIECILCGQANARQLCRGKVPVVCAVVESVTERGVDAGVTLRDPTGNYLMLLFCGTPPADGGWKWSPEGSSPSRSVGRWADPSRPGMHNTRIGSAPADGHLSQVDFPSNSHHAGQEHQVPKTSAAGVFGRTRKQFAVGCGSQHPLWFNTLPRKDRLESFN